MCWQDVEQWFRPVPCSTLLPGVPSGWSCLQRTPAGIGNPYPDHTNLAPERAMLLRVEGHMLLDSALSRSLMNSGHDRGGLTCAGCTTGVSGARGGKLAAATGTSSAADRRKARTAGWRTAWEVHVCDAGSSSSSQDGSACNTGSWVSSERSRCGAPRPERRQAAPKGISRAQLRCDTAEYVHADLQATRLHRSHLS